jgi:hypothetical protein
MELDDNEILAAAQQEQLVNPRRSVVNSESAFVANRLSAAGYTQLANRYWNWITMPQASKNPGFSDEVLELQKQLDAIDQQVSMPSWGHRGT